MIDIILNLFMFWFIYSLLGWVVEVIYAVIMKKGYDTRNRTNGPINPGYGIAAIVILTLLRDFKDNVFFVFFSGGILATVLEFFAHWFFEKTLGVKLWDYSERNFNIQGRVCLVNSILFGLLCVLMVNIIHPYIDQFVVNLSQNFKFIFTLIVSILYTNELTIIFLSVATLRRILNIISDLWNAIIKINPNNFPDFREYVADVYNDNLVWYNQQEIEISDEFKEKYNFNLNLYDDSYEDEQNILILRLSQIIRDNFSQRNIYQKILYRVFPDLKSMDHKEIFEAMKDIQEENR